jgi:polysaccharide export outer membrane protein
MRFRPILLFVALLTTTACAERGAGPVLSTGDRYGAATSTIADYKLGVGDRIKINVYNEPTLSGEYAVGANGSVSLPLIGDVPASGRTLDEMIAEARTRLADGFLRDPKVSGEVSIFRPYFILGEVNTPGDYPYSVGLTAMNAIAAAKGFTPRANRDVVIIRRQGETSEVNYRLTPELMIYPGDTIRVGERYF